MKIVIVVIAYNRDKSLNRLLNSLSKANYLGNLDIDLIISIDKSDNLEVKNIANKFKWIFGNKIIMSHTENLGLRKHILAAGDYVKNYDAIIMLEDDLYVSNDFFNYSIQALDFYKNCSKISGISLYNNEWNQSANRPFYPLDNGTDVYFLQLAQSWGQVWSKDNWMDFKEWYLKNDENFLNINMPENIKNWPKSSWLKYHIKYLIEKNKFFVFPRVSLSTNCNEMGKHVNIKNSNYQVNLVNNIQKKYRFKNIDADKYIYDSFYEVKDFKIEINSQIYDVEMDLYGTKKNIRKKYLASSKYLNYKIIRSYELFFRPHENNLLNDIIGNDIFIYDTEIKVKQNIFANYIEEKKRVYDMKNLSFKDIYFFLKYKINVKLRRNIYK